MKSFAINFKGGFAFTNDGNTLVNIINEVAEVEVTKSGSLFGAYVMCCRKYTDQITPNLTREPQPKLPKFEDFQDQLFIDATFFKTYKPIRVFAFIAENVVGIFEGLPQNVVPTVVGCLFDYNNAMIKEFPDFKSAEMWINFFYFRLIYPMSGYLLEDIPYVTFVSNQLSMLNYMTWLEQHCICSLDKWRLPEAPPQIQNGSEIEIPVNRLVDFSNDNK